MADEKDPTLRALVREVRELKVKVENMAEDQAATVEACKRLEADVANLKGAEGGKAKSLFDFD